MLTSFTTPVNLPGKTMPGPPKQAPPSTTEGAKTATAAKASSFDQDKKGGLASQNAPKQSPSKVGAGNDDNSAKTNSN
jgi:hypothetical protein